MWMWFVIVKAKARTWSASDLGSKFNDIANEQAFASVRFQLSIFHEGPVHGVYVFDIHALENVSMRLLKNLGSDLPCFRALQREWHVFLTLPLTRTTYCLGLGVSRESRS